MDEEKKWYELDPNSNCPDCGQKFAGCHDTHKTVTLGQKYHLNGVAYGPGPSVVPVEADMFVGL